MLVCSLNCYPQPLYLIPQNSKRVSDAEEGINSAITSAKSKAQLVSMRSQVTVDKNQIINHSPDSSVLNYDVTNMHDILYNTCYEVLDMSVYDYKQKEILCHNIMKFNINYMLIISYLIYIVLHQ